MSTTGTPSTRATGDFAEQAVAQYLAQQGLRLIAKQYRERHGEIDLILLDGDALVFVEVRYRKHAQFGGGLASVTRSKQSRLILAAQAFLAAHPKWSTWPCRFDVVAAHGPANALQFDWCKNAFDAGD